MDTNPPLLIDEALLERATEAARASPRRRRNLNLHAAETEPANRLLNAVEPGSYVQPHRHLDSAKDETFVVLRGAFGLVLFDDGGAVTRTAVLCAGGPVQGANVPHATWHSVLALEPGSVFLEAKGGPYRPLDPEERAAWAPAEGEPAAAAYLARLEALFR